MKLKYFELCKTLIKKSTHHQHHLSCVIVNKNKIISMGWNQIKTSPKSPHKYNMLHAEIHALLGVPYEKLKGCKAYVYRQDKNGNLAISKPCKACETALKLAGIKKVYYSTKNGYTEEKYA